MKDRESMEKKKVVFVVPSLRMGGAEKNAVNIMNRLDKQKYSVHLVLFEQTGSLLSEVGPNITVEELRSRNKVHKIVQLYKAVRSIKPAIVFSTVINANILAGIVSFFYRDCLYIGRETTVHSKLLERNTSIMKKVISLWYQLFISRLDTIIAQSQFMKKELIALFSLDPKKIVVLPNPINVDLESHFSAVEEKNKDVINLLSVGRLVPLKRMSLLLEVMHKLEDNYQLTIIGDGPEKGKLEESLRQMNLEERVILLGEIADPTTYYRNSDLFIVASAYDSYPNVIMEALSVGLRVVAFDVPGAINEILSEPIRGRLIVDNEIDQYVKAIKEECDKQYSSESVRESIEKQNWYQYINIIERLFAG